MIILVTSGATVTFKKLVSAAVDPLFWDSIGNGKATKLYIQYGNETSNGVHISEEFFHQLSSATLHKWIKSTDPKLPGEYTCTYTSNKSNHPLHVTAFSFSHDIGSLITSADVVISHAGTGSIIDALSREKPLIVVPNTDLMDNHQLEVAHALEEKGCCIVSSTEGLVEAVEPLINGHDHKFTPFTSSTFSPLQSIIYAEAEKGN